eukprot:CAMPEP_0195525818 /NCGR_PEP_ID=MMETSP0794_2-20130614/26457_1 /TAXON_ID=515487 /ORGANISM="Stephanopyxis turris, Strain CCMP 815" /LENGTH=280 /DNA_ID=CAMNT_0040656357 /DNA_START=85 /DNA_END=923 /DNA_ORIENTATION=-
MTNPHHPPVSQHKDTNNWTAWQLNNASYKDLGTPPMVGKRFLRHLLTSERCISSLLTLLQAEPSTTRDFSLEVDAFELHNSDVVLGTMLLRYPTTLLPLLEEAIVEAQRELLKRLPQVATSKIPNTNSIKGERRGGGDDNDNHTSHQITRVHARIIHLPPHSSCCKPSISSIGACDVGKMMQLCGTVVRASPVRMYESARAYKCKARGCGRTFVMYADLEQVNNALPVPTVCPNLNGADGCSGTKFDVIPGGAVHTDFQEVKIQESASRLGIGSIPRSLL